MEEEVTLQNSELNNSVIDIAKPKKKRIWEIDFIRGLCVILMIFDHFMYDIWDFGNTWRNAGMYTAGYGYWFSDYRGIIRPIVLFFFFFIAGISCCFSKSNFTRALQAIAFAYCISVVGSFLGLFFEFNIMFGALHALGFSMLIYAVLDTFDKSIYSKLAVGLCIMIMYILMEQNLYPYLATIGVCAAIAGCLIIIISVLTKQKIHSEFVITGLIIIVTGILMVIIYTVTRHSVSFELPSNFQWLNDVMSGQYATSGFSSTDYFPLIPWTGIFLLGSVFGRLFYKERKSLLPKLDAKYTKPVEYVGRHALFVYILHQVIIFGMFVVVALICGFNPPF